MTFLKSHSYLLLLLLPVMGLSVGFLFTSKSSSVQAKIITRTMWLAFIFALLFWPLELCQKSQESLVGIRPDELSWILATFILCLSATVHQFSIRYMKGDSQNLKYFYNLCLLTVAMLCLIAQDNIIIFCLCLAFCNLLLTKLMKHKGNWEQAVQSARLAKKYLGASFAWLSLTAGFTSISTNTYSIAEIKEHFLQNPNLSLFPASCLIMCCLLQSAVFPFHKWLLSSLNSPTGVSAFMHAGLINGAGILLARFAWLFHTQTALLDIFVVWGLVAAVFGMACKMIQTDVKRALACSTVGQMGFMLMQAGLGLFSSMLAHIICHGLFKAYLFLQSGSSLQQKNVVLESKSQSCLSVIAALVCSLFAVSGFCAISPSLLSFYDTSLLLLLFAFIAAYQVANSILDTSTSWHTCLIGAIACFAAGTFYGWTTSSIKQLVAPLDLWQPRELHAGHQALALLILAIWLFDKFSMRTRLADTTFYKKMYVRALNASQPHPDTVTSSRLAYQH